MIIFTRLCILVVLIFSCAVLRAQSSSIKSFSLQEDSRPVAINCIFKSSEGFFYVGTNTGLFNFDGANFNKIYFKNKDYNDTITAIAQDAGKTIWTGFKSGRLATVVNGQLQFYNPEEGTPSKRISAISFDAKNNLWYAAYGEGIYYRRNNQHYLLNADNGLTDLNINSLCKTVSGEMLAASDQGLVICPALGTSNKVKIISPADGLPDYIVNAISPEATNRFWVGLQDKGFCLYDHKQQKILALPVMAEWNYGEVNDLMQDGNQLWIATQESGLIKYDIASNKFASTGLTAPNDVHQLLRDLQGNIWISNHQNKLLNIKENSMEIIPYKIPGLYEKIHAVLHDSEGNLWLGEDQGVYKFDLENPGTPSQRIAVPVELETDITALYEDPFRNIWIGTMGKGLFVYNKKSQTLKHGSNDPGLMEASVLSISGRGNTMYVCSLQGAMSIEFVDSGTGVFNITKMDGMNGATHFIYNVFKDSKGKVWYATDGDGLWMQQGETLTEFGEKDNIKDLHVYSITEDKNGNIWFSTASSGLYKYDGKTFRNFGIREGISDLYISVVKTLGSGHIAVVNKSGIDIIDPLSGRISYLPSADIGVINADNLGAVSMDKQGRIMVAGERGIIAYDVPTGSVLQPKTILESVQLFDQRISEGNNIFAHDENNFTFNFIGLHFTDPAAVFYQYKMEGLDTSWLNTMDKSQTFSKLPPGKYTFHVRSSLNKNFDNASEAYFSFTIKRAFYTTWWFILLCGAALAWLLVAIIRNRENQIKKMQVLQHEKMLFQFEVLRNQVNPHFLFNSFNTLISTIEEDPKMAVEYTEQLSDFFRNIVSYRDKETIVLSEELELLNTYFFLQRKRYGEALQMTVNISEQQKQAFKIPPLSLQLLLENAMKHNVVSKDSPLLVEISFVAPDTLTVFNKKNKRNILQSGAGLGLQNIRNRFALLTKRPVEIEDTTTHFLVKLPLVSNDSV